MSVGIYADNGAYNVTVVPSSGAAAGSYAPDGSYRVVITNQVPYVPLHPGYSSGNWYNPVDAPTIQSAAVTANTLRLLPFFLPTAMTIQALACRINTTDATGGVAAGLAIYAAMSSGAAYRDATGLPLASVTGISVASSANVSVALGQNVTLQGGLYWMGILTSSATATFQTVTTLQAHASYWVGSANLANVQTSSTIGAFSRALAATYPTFPDCTGQTFTTVTGITNSIVYLQAA